MTEIWNDTSKQLANSILELIKYETSWNMTKVNFYTENLWKNTNSHSIMAWIVFLIAKGIEPIDIYKLLRVELQLPPMKD